MPKNSPKNGMNIFHNEIAAPLATDVTITEDAITVRLADGRIITAPLLWFPRLRYGNKKERNHWRLIGDGDGIHWPDLDEDISVEGLLAGRMSAESSSSLKRWLAARTGRSHRKASVEAVKR